tara:strand:+ start:129 stop:785 length:657 start_codon:yes stop_codon:yes gene_type:complete
MEIDLILRSNEDTVVSVEITERDTCLDAINKSGLLPRDGSITHAWDIYGNIIDGKLAKNYIFGGFFVGIIPKIGNFLCEEIVKKGKKKIKFGKGIIEGGITAFVPYFQDGMFSTIAISEYWNTGGGVRCNAYPVNLLGEPYPLGTYVYLKINGKLYNPMTNQFDLPIIVESDPHVIMSHYNGVCVVIKIISTNPLRGKLIPSKTKDINRNLVKIRKNM